MTPSDAVPPVQYLKYAEVYEQLARQQAGDIEFALANDLVIVEGPWREIPAQQVAYVGIDENDRRVRLPAISTRWRYKPRPGVVFRRPDGIIPLRVYLGRQLPGIVTCRPQGQSPVQADGVVDGKDFYFRSRGEHWSMSIGGADVVGAPEWYYEEPYGTWPEAGRISEEQTYDFIAKAADRFRTGHPTMTERTIDRGTASILAAIGSLKPTDKVE